ncbi:hypothetical protein [Aerolutibacter ruishenii]|uniref:Heavy-metal-binding protein n=1 Tax=Aerolutibacter ruishenii TaxID=686800 RepID=A0A562M2Y5_9GAMM|nr:hypothetical protein [Lysobacter ruishenii]TWI14230.1 hypothetical protein IP93_00225 [Lysobacter ruishenii]
MAMRAMLVVGMLLVAVPAHAGEAASAQTVPVLEAVPGCVEAKMGRVSVSIGSKDTRGARGVSYQRAFDKLARAAADHGGNAVVLRQHEAAYVTRSKKLDPRPGYIALEGLVIRVPTDAATCALAAMDVDAFAERSAGAEREQITTENKSF